MIANTVKSFRAEIERLQCDVGAPRSVIESTIEVGGQGIFAGMSTGPVTAVMTDSYRFDEWHIKAERSCDRSPDLGYFKRMSHSRSLMVLREHKDLCLAAESAERRIMQDAIAVTFKARAVRIGSFIDCPITGSVRARCMLGEKLALPLLSNLTSENRRRADFGSGVGMSQNNLRSGIASHRRGPAISPLVGSIGVGQVIHIVRVRDAAGVARHCGVRIGPMSQFVDECQLNVKAGDGGAGCVSFRREGPVVHGGPNGGDGGNGGDIWFIADHNVASLLAFRDYPHRKAGSGVHGKGKDMHGRRGESLEIPVPMGTVISDMYGGELLAELVNHGDRWLAVAGGRGGRGNAKFLSNKRRAPNFAEQGEHGEERWLKMELRLMADVALVGFPNVGKSTLISVISQAKPKIANYPFTTLEPNLGVVALDEDTEFVVADIPGLIEGASEGKGLGHQFLRHIERALVLCIMLDLAPMDGVSPQEQERVLLQELGQYQPDLLQRPRVVVGTKSDAVQLEELHALGWEGDVISSVTRSGLNHLVGKLAQRVHDARQATEYAEGVVTIRPEAKGAVVELVEPGHFRLVGREVERIVALNDVTTPEALSYIDHRLERIGVPKMLAKAGAQEGDVIWIAGFSFEYSPDV